VTLQVGLFSTDFAWKGPFADDATTWGGVGEVVYQLATRLAGRGHDIVVVTSSPGESERTTADGVTLLDYGTQLPVGNKHVSVSMLASYLSESFDLIHTHRGLPSGALAGGAHAWLRDTPHVLTVHGDLHYMSGTPIRNGLLRAFERLSPRLLTSADAVTTVSESFRSASPYLEGVRADTLVITNGAEPREPTDPSAVRAARERLGLPEDNDVVLFLSTLEPRKHPGTLLNAVPGVLDDHPETTFVFAGGGDRLSKFRTKVAERGLGNRVTFERFVPEAEKESYYRAADAYCLPSEAESCGLAPLEAAAHGLPLVLGDIPVFEELFGDAATLVQPGSPAAIEAAVSGLLGDPERRTRMSDRSRAVAERHSWEEMVDGYESVYRDVLSP